MRTECISDTNFKGQIVKTGKNFSTKPQQCIANMENSINDLIESKPFDLYIHQDYSKNEIVFETDNIEISKRIPVASKASKYIEAAKNVIEEHENAEIAAREQEWEKSQNKAEVKDMFYTLLYFAALPFLYMAESFKDGAKDLKTNFNKLAKKLATKKG